ncbi:hypothetical protein B0H34DRAFT_786325 [Crassisporium funariophilum]|nr:hypothetical protein B0H34DRAFT_786325 [Crassisporium funariophilum]
MPDSVLQTLNPQNQARLQVRINQIDYTLAPPGDLDNSSLPRVPVLRIYGSSSTGQAACVHIHQAYPYFFVDYKGKLNPSHANRYIAKLTRSLNHAVALSLKKDPLSARSQFIRAVVLVKGNNFYGFHASYTPFLKILVADPSYVNRIATILQSGSVMSTRFCVYETHLSFVLQFLCDFGLYGCGVIELEDALQRCAEVDELEESVSSGESISVKFQPSSYFRESRLPLEVDVIAPLILNRHRLVARNLHRRLEIPAPKLPPEPLVLSVRELWEDERHRRRALGLNPSPEIPIDPSESSRSTGGEWVAEARWWDEIRKRLEKGSDSGGSPDDQHQDWERFVMSTFESIEAIWPQKYKVWKPARSTTAYVEGDGEIQHTDQPLDIPLDVKSGQGPEEKDGLIDVDISKLSEQELSRIDQAEALDGDIKAPLIQQDVEDHEDDAEHHPEYDEDVQEPETEDANQLEEELSRSMNPFTENSDEVADPKTPEYRFPSPPTPTCMSQRERESQTPTKASDSHEQHSFLDTKSEGLTGTNEMKQSTNAVRFMVNHRQNVTPTKSNSTPGDNALLAVHENYSLSSCNIVEPADEINPFLIIPTSMSAKERSSLITARAVHLSKVFNICGTTNPNRYVYFRPPPSLPELKDSLQVLALPYKLYQAPFYSQDDDIPELAKEYAGLSYRLKGGQGIATLKEWTTNELGEAFKGSNGSLPLNSSGIGGWEYTSHPPSFKEVRQSMDTIDSRSAGGRRAKLRSQIEGPTQANIYGFKTSPIGDHGSREKANMSIMSLEVFVPTREANVADPEVDEIFAIFYAYHISGGDISHRGVLVLQDAQFEQRRLRHAKIEAYATELDLLNRLVDLVIELDPDILTGWEVQCTSWGYVEARGRSHGLDIPSILSRAPPRGSGGGTDQWGLRKTSTFKVTGRHVFNLWRIMRSENTLTLYTFENVVFTVLRRRVPKYSFKTLTAWYQSLVPAQTLLLFQFLDMRVATNLELLEEAETVTKTAEFARVFGVDFFSVISRGSQFKVESFMFRIAKPESFVLISPNKSDVGKQNAAECMPLIMEPVSAFYSSPLVVLDFQSLYPSIMIAYNYCYSTCLGRVTEFKGAYKFGILDHLDIPPALLNKLQDHITVAPNGIMYVKSDVRRGLLGRMLVELLETRVMVKQAMKGVGGDKARKRILDARQLGLKYIANVTYGYTSASFSGRMPAVEIADSIVQSGRETLEKVGHSAGLYILLTECHKAIDIIDNTKKWGAKVVYGDTDSVFVYLLGKTKEQAFSIGNEIAETITALNPSPVKLKFEKVYLPCVLMAKKRYVGFKYESIDDTEPVFDAKGIETVRRDGVLAQRKMVENCLKILFRTQDLSEVKDYCCRSWQKLLQNKASVQEFIFAKEVRMGTYSDKGPPPPGAVVAARRSVHDPNNEAQYGDRIPYVIVRGAPGSRLVDRAMDPMEFLDSDNLHLDANYYITRVLIPPLARIFNLVGADVEQWFNEMPKATIPELVSPKKPKVTAPSASQDRTNIDEHFLTMQCLSCGELASQKLCENCYVSKQETISNLGFRIRAREQRLTNAHRICVSCTNSSPDNPIECESIDCPWLYARRKAEEAMDLVPLLTELSEALETDVERQELQSEESEDEMKLYESEEHSQIEFDDEFDRRLGLRALQLA